MNQELEYLIECWKKDRLERLEEELRNPFAYGGEKTPLTVLDLAVLLRFNHEIRELIKAIARPDDTAGIASETGKEHLDFIPHSVRSSHSLTFPERLFSLYKWAREDGEICKKWLRPEGENDQREFLRFIVVCADRNNIENLWDILRDRCKGEDRESTREELDLLRECIVLYNLKFKDRRALTLSDDTTDLEAYNAKKHDRVNSKGDRVISVYLPGLKDADGRIVRPTLVKTG